ncbi:MAG: hypothetical protein U0136_21160 [Bdellovibrionota bacterium]
MIARDSVFGRAGVVCRAALLAAHAVFRPQGPRLRDIHFIVLLFSNWLETALGEEPIEPRSMQVSRFLQSLRDMGCVREVRRSKVPRYLLTRSGVVDVLREITEEPLFRRPSMLLFVRYFLTNYRNIIFEMVTEQSEQFPRGLRMEIDELLDVSVLMKRQITQAEMAVKKLQVRAQFSRDMGQLAARRLREGKPYRDVVAELEKTHPYDLNSQKPLTELYASIPPEHARWELTSGALSRSDDLWAPMGELWGQYLSLLQSLDRISPSRRGRS